MDFLKKAAVLAVCFRNGAICRGSRIVSFEVIVEKIARKFPGYKVYGVYTGQVAAEKLSGREGLGICSLENTPGSDAADKLSGREELRICNLENALERAAAEGTTTLIVQPMYLLDGYEYRKLAGILKVCGGRFGQIVLGAPLLSEDADFVAVAKAIAGRVADQIDGVTAICFVGHGTGMASNRAYGKLQEKLAEEGYTDHYIGTLRAEPSLDDVVKALKANGNYQRVVLMPLMAAAGVHVSRDIAGKGPGSWRSALEREGYAVTCIPEGIGQIRAIQDLYVAHVQKAVDGLGSGNWNRLDALNEQI